ncbi:AAA family ATPase [Nostoc sp.]|uniref:AAA family ATPase n=1 Tax=Nostoc sp. TaxID=1180 RepID=UPI002FF8EE19
MLESFRLKNFKAVQDSKTVNFTPLTVFIGNNGSGKSSLIEGLATYRMMIISSQNNAMKPWLGFNHIRNHAVPHLFQDSGVERPYETNPIEFHLKTKNYETTMIVTKGQGIDEVFIQEESLKVHGKLEVKRNAQGEVYLPQKSEILPSKWSDHESIIDCSFLRNEFWRNKLPSLEILENIILHWQFLNLNSQIMGLPLTKTDNSYKRLLENDGSNIAEYLRLIYQQDKSAYNGIIETIKYVLPYTQDIQPKLTSDSKQNLYIELTEDGFKVPSWLLSTGTLRILALLAILRNPQPAPLIVIEEIENGLDPRSIHLIVEEIKNVVEAGKAQIILTTHSPYLLDQLTLSQIILVERDQNGQPTFSRPGDQKSLQEWSKKFTPGKLYTMNRLSQKG